MEIVSHGLECELFCLLSGEFLVAAFFWMKHWVTWSDKKECTYWGQWERILGIGKFPIGIGKLQLCYITPPSLLPLPPPSPTKIGAKTFWALCQCLSCAFCLALDKVQPETQDQQDIYRHLLRGVGLCDCGGSVGEAVRKGRLEPWGMSWGYQPQTEFLLLLGNCNLVFKAFHRLNQTNSDYWG